MFFYIISGDLVEDFRIIFLIILKFTGRRLVFLVKYKYIKLGFKVK